MSPEAVPSRLRFSGFPVPTYGIHGRANRSAFSGSLRPEGPTAPPTPPVRWSAPAARVAAYYRRPDPPSVPTGVDLAVLPGSVSVSPIIVVAGDNVIVRAQIENVGASRVGTSSVSYWVRYDEAGAEWVRLIQQTTGALAVASARTVTATRRITADDPSGSLYAAVCVAATGDVDTDNDCRIAAQTLVIRDVSAVSGGSLVVEADGKLAVGAEGQTEFMINDVTGEQFQIQQHWILLGYEPVDEDVWGAVQQWDCFEEVRADCWNSDGTEKATADWGLAHPRMGFRFGRDVRRASRSRGVFVVG